MPTLLSISNWLDSLETKDVVTLIGICVTFAATIYSILVGIRNSKRTIFINSITASRIKYINELKENVSDFLGATNYFILGGFAEKETATSCYQKIDRLRFLIKFQLNPHHKYDILMIETIDKIIDMAHPGMLTTDQITAEMNILTDLTQALLKYEWEGIKFESKTGRISEKVKKRNTKKILEPAMARFKAHKEKQ